MDVPPLGSASPVTFYLKRGLVVPVVINLGGGVEWTDTLTALGTVGATFAVVTFQIISTVSSRRAKQRELAEQVFAFRVPVPEERFRKRSGGSLVSIYNTGATVIQHVFYQVLPLGEFIFYGPMVPPTEPATKIVDEEVGYNGMTVAIRFRDANGLGWERSLTGVLRRRKSFDTQEMQWLKSRYGRMRLRLRYRSGSGNQEHSAAYSRLLDTRRLSNLN